MNLYLKIQRAFKTLINGGTDPIADNKSEEQIVAAHMAAQMKTREYRIDGF